MEKIPSMALSARFRHRSESSAKNDVRHEMRIGLQPKYVDGSRTADNSVIIKPESPAKLRKLCIERREQRDMSRAPKITMSVSSSLIITFGVGLQKHVHNLSVDDQDALLEAVAKAVTDHVGIELTGLVGHRDETAFHGHGQSPAYNSEGQPMGKVITQKIASEIQTVAMEAAREFLPMIERGKKKAERIADGEDPSAVYNRSVKELHEDLPQEIAAARKQLDTALSRVAEMEGRVAELKAKEELNAAQAKRLATYERRLVARKAEEVAALSQEARLVRLASDALDDREDAVEAREADVDSREAAIEAREAVVAEKESKLRRLNAAVTSMLGDVTDYLGVTRSLKALSDLIRNTIIPDEPEAADGDDPGELTM